MHFAKIARGLARGKLVSERLTGSLVGEGGDAAAGRVCRHLHVDVVSRGDVPALVKELDRLLRPPFVPRCVTLLAFRRLTMKMVLKLLTTDGAVTVDENTGLHKSVSTVTTAGTVNANPHSDRVVRVLAGDVGNDEATFDIGYSLAAQERSRPVGVGERASAESRGAAAQWRATWRGRDSPKVGNGSSQSQSKSRLHSRIARCVKKTCGKKRDPMRIWA